MSDSIQTLIEGKIRAILEKGEKVPIRLDETVPEGGLYFEEYLIGSAAAKRAYTPVKSPILPKFAVVCHPSLWDVLDDAVKALFEPWPIIIAPPSGS